MATVRQFLLIGDAGDHSIQRGDRIEILTAYQRSEFQVALADKLCINGKARQFGIPAITATRLNRTGPVDGEIVELSRIGRDLLVSVSTEENQPPLSRLQRFSTEAESIKGEV